MLVAPHAESIQWRHDVGRSGGQPVADRGRQGRNDTIAARFPNGATAMIASFPTTLYDWLWCAFAAVSAICIFGVAPWMLGGRQRPDAALGYSLFEWMIPCVFGGILGLVGGYGGTAIVLGLVGAMLSDVLPMEGTVFHVFFWIGVVLGLALSALLVARLIIRPHNPNKDSRPPTVREALRPAVLITVCLTGLILGLGPIHKREMAMIRRDIDAAKTKSVGAYLEEHHREYEAYPRDLRQLAELERFSANTLR